MRKPINKIIDVPEGMKVEITNKEIIAEKDGKKANKRLPYSKKISVEVKENKISIKSDKPTKREKELCGTIEGHINNCMKGLNEPYIYKLEICNVHFPMNVKIENNKVVVKNFLGEKVDRIANILEGVEANLKGSIIELKSSDKDSAGQSAANIEQATKVKNRDRKVFQDGIYIIEKGGIPI